MRLTGQPAAVFGAIVAHRLGATLGDLAASTDLEPRLLHPIVARLRDRGLAKVIAHQPSGGHRPLCVWAPPWHPAAAIPANSGGHATSTRVLRYLRGGEATIREIASGLGLRYGAARMMVAALERRGLVEWTGRRLTPDRQGQGQAQKLWRRT